MKLRSFYLLLCVLGTVLPLSQFIPWLLSQAMDSAIFIRFFTELFSTRIGSFFGLDVMVSALAVLGMVQVEGRRLAMQHRWLPMAATLLVGVSLGLPLFLAMREKIRGQATTQ